MYCRRMRSCAPGLWGECLWAAALRRRPANPGPDTTAGRNASTQKNEIQKDAPRPHEGPADSRQYARFRRLWPQGRRAELAYQPADRVRKASHHRPCPPRRPDLDTRIPRQAGKLQASGDAHGWRQGRRGSLGWRPSDGDACFLKWRTCRKIWRREALRLASHKLPMPTRIVARSEEI